MASPIYENSWAVLESTRKTFGLNSTCQSCNAKSNLAGLWNLGDFSTLKFQWDNWKTMGQQEPSCLRWPVCDCCNASQMLQPPHLHQGSHWKVLWLPGHLLRCPLCRWEGEERLEVTREWHPLPLDITHEIWRDLKAVRPEERSVWLHEWQMFSGQFVSTAHRPLPSWHFLLYLPHRSCVHWNLIPDVYARESSAAPQAP